MDLHEQDTTAQGKAVAAQSEPRSLPIAERGIKTGADFAHLMSAVMSDLIAGRMTPSIGNATCNAGGKLLRVVELQYRFGTQNGGNQNDKVLILAPDTQAAA